MDDYLQAHRGSWCVLLRHRVPDTWNQSLPLCPGWRRFAPANRGPYKDIELSEVGPLELYDCLLHEDSLTEVSVLRSRSEPLIVLHPRFMGEDVSVFVEFLEQSMETLVKDSIYPVKVQARFRQPLPTPLDKASVADESVLPFGSLVVTTPNQEFSHLDPTNSYAEARQRLKDKIISLRYISVSEDASMRLTLQPNRDRGNTLKEFTKVAQGIQQLLEKDLICPTETFFTIDAPWNIPVFALPSIRDA